MDMFEPLLQKQVNEIDCSFTSNIFRFFKFDLFVCHHFQNRHEKDFFANYFQTRFDCTDFFDDEKYLEITSKKTKFARPGFITKCGDKIYAHIVCHGFRLGKLFESLLTTFKASVISLR